ncbi:bifunctional UDP-N-acetylglucosamine diphosphorylase/glucosamine-1-phosphate N-acetyltransferase GlmU [Clostridium amazonitimonense]|uniref:bifunctional UDP-N-acetylglucosamine diphosphorylase/glucosamine-1-phosphate N-acetyltransferase GlmU n=1 Tax=Clostridium amazonitimonense TaxID=1499689 RepID=UPI000509F61F|nr:bifunctional UDP-N-acetylglucosamine diphosphorylase/glucosamine-1-phosphate N-acetyltransferase GlmU [Clostridium amazonitimonense]
MYKCAIILAAGEGKRMKSTTPKVLHKVCGKEMVNHVIDIMRIADLSDINIVIGKGADKVKESTRFRDVSYSYQDKQLGTGHAIICSKEFLKHKKGIVAIFNGDVPLMRAETVKKLIETHENNGYKCTIVTSLLNDPTGYGRIVRREGVVDKIVEHKDCNKEELSINEINAGIYCFDIESLVKSLDKLNNNNAQGEYYLTDVIEILRSEDNTVGAMIVDYEETMGVNSRVELAEVEKILRNRINKKHLENGVTLIDAENTYIGADVQIGQDTIIYPGNAIEGKTVIKENCVLYPNSRIKDSIIEQGVSIQSSVILESHIGEETTVGPFAYIRPESTIGKHARIGDFVEIKKSTIGDNTKVSHLTYIGDAEVGEDCNFGCGTVIVNYDGKAKYKTKIGNRAFIGCNTNLVAPVEVKDNSYIAAGSTITNEVPEGSLAIARAKQKNIEGWVDKKGLKK